METKQKKTMSVREMGRLLGLKKVESYWLVHKEYFDTVLVSGKMRVVIESFEHWYAGQVKYRKVTGEPPGEKLRQESYSAQDMGKMLGVSEDVAYYIINRYELPTILVDYWKRVPREAFEKWYASQSKYRTLEDQEKDAELERHSMTMPEMARLLDVPRKTVYEIMRSERGRKTLQVIKLAGKKRILNRSFDIWYAGQTEYLKPEDRAGHPEAANIHYADCLKSSPKRTKKETPKAVSSNPEYLTVDEAALMAGVEHGRILKWIRKNRFPVVRSGKKLIRIPRTTFEDFLLKTHETEE
ncbi:MAG: helix-turn-helix domain-containing protein [Lachnospiraceae bacterium]|nr:helix-turn-helix domain-containing protein [Lachnospiraceae bacterium]